MQVSVATGSNETAPFQLVNAKHIMIFRITGAGSVEKMSSPHTVLMIFRQN
jgi:hypothetical protein